MARLTARFGKLHAAARKKIGRPERTGEWQYEFLLDGKFQFKITVPDSHGRDTAVVDFGTIRSIVRQLKLTQDEFSEWLKCPLDREEYERLMRERLGL